MCRTVGTKFAQTLNSNSLKYASVFQAASISKSRNPRPIFRPTRRSTEMSPEGEDYRWGGTRMATIFPHGLKLFRLTINLSKRGYTEGVMGINRFLNSSQSADYQSDLELATALRLNCSSWRFPRGRTVCRHALLHSQGRRPSRLSSFFPRSGRSLAACCPCQPHRGAPIQPRAKRVSERRPGKHGQGGPALQGRSKSRLDWGARTGLDRFVVFSQGVALG